MAKILFLDDKNKVVFKSSTFTPGVRNLIRYSGLTAVITNDDEKFDMKDVTYARQSSEDYVVGDIVFNYNYSKNFTVTGFENKRPVLEEIDPVNPKQPTLCFPISEWLYPKVPGTPRDEIKENIESFIKTKSLTIIRYTAENLLENNLTEAQKSIIKSISVENKLDLIYALCHEYLGNHKEAKELRDYAESKKSNPT